MLRKATARPSGVARIQASVGSEAGSPFSGWTLRKSVTCRASAHSWASMRPSISTAAAGAASRHAASERALHSEHCSISDRFAPWMQGRRLRLQRELHWIAACTSVREKQAQFLAAGLAAASLQRAAREKLMLDPSPATLRPRARYWVAVLLTPIAFIAAMDAIDRPPALDAFEISKAAQLFSDAVEPPDFRAAEQVEIPQPLQPALQGTTSAWYQATLHVDAQPRGTVGCLPVVDVRQLRRARERRADRRERADDPSVSILSRAAVLRVSCEPAARRGQHDRSALGVRA